MDAAPVHTVDAALRALRDWPRSGHTTPLHLEPESLVQLGEVPGLQLCFPRRGKPYTQRTWDTAKPGAGPSEGVLSVLCSCLPRSQRVPSVHWAPNRCAMPNRRREPLAQPS